MASGKLESQQGLFNCKPQTINYKLESGKRLINKRK